ncbi:hypothetical protein RIF29_08308 [Crotalaria pallida]|uniref:Uncharacterized protein n=1 Tax=Crotalaria pallida TaxID=3830 RepID=A0AAN9J6G9_CROPI
MASSSGSSWIVAASNRSNSAAKSFPKLISQTDSRTVEAEDWRERGRRMMVDCEDGAATGGSEGEERPGVVKEKGIVSRLCNRIARPIEKKKKEEEATDPHTLAIIRRR